MNDWCLLQFALVHYFTKLGAGEYYLEELEETICMAELRIKEKRFAAFIFEVIIEWFGKSLYTWSLACAFF